MGMLLVISAMSVLTQRATGTHEILWSVRDKFQIFKMALLKAVRWNKESEERISQMKDVWMTRPGMLQARSRFRGPSRTPGGLGLSHLADNPPPAPLHCNSGERGVVWHSPRMGLPYQGREMVPAPTSSGPAFYLRLCHPSGISQKALPRAHSSAGLPSQTLMRKS